MPCFPPPRRGARTITTPTVNPYLYRGEQYDADLNAYYLRARYYQPGIGRFLTTDPVEGFPTTPVSLHRYLYANCDPMNVIDPSGQYSLTELEAALIIVDTNLALTVASNFDAVKNVYASLGEKVFPDAAVLGVQGAMGSDLLRFIFGLFHRPLPYNLLGKTAFKVVGGAEVLFSITSGEVALFAVGGWELQAGQVFSAPFRIPGRHNDFGGSVYSGFVFNLWNAEDYKGPFVSYGITSSRFGTGLTIFGAPGMWLKGPWGIGKTIRSWSTRHSQDRLAGYGVSLSRQRTTYKLLAKGEYPSEYAVLPSLMALAFIDTVCQQNNTISNLKVPAIAVKWLLQTSLWYQVTLAKHYWNQKTGHDPKYRQDNPRPTGYQSGPSFPYFH